VDVHDHDGRPRARLGDQVVDDLPHRVGGVEEERAEQVQHGDRRPVPGLDHRQPVAGRRRLEVGGAHDRRRGGEVRPDLLPPPRVVAERERVRARREQPLRQPRRDPDAVRDVLPVDYADVDLETLAQPRQQALDRIAAGSPDDVADEEDPHRVSTYGSEPGEG